MAVAFANIFMSRIETEIISKSKTKPLEWKRCIDDVFSLWKKGDKSICLRSKHTSSYEISGKEIPFLDTAIFKGERFYEDAILDIRTHFKPTETFQYTHFTSCHAPVVKKVFKNYLKKALTSSSHTCVFEDIQIIW